ncbi:MAG TPA: response regulator [Phycisphaerae bacterium]|nr:response regulator [Phycisphaerae bacterium]
MPEQSSVARVLVVDDEPELRELLVDALTDANVQVQAAGSGKEAIDLARIHRPDVLVTDLCLSDCNGLEVIDRLRSAMGDIPAVVITGHGDPAALTDASRRRPIELMTKPLDLDRLRRTVRDELGRQAYRREARRRTRRLRVLARKSNLERKTIHRQLETTCADLTEAYRSLSSRLNLQQIVLGYQRELLAAKNDDDVFRTLFHLFVRRSGMVFGVAMVCDGEAELQIIGRFGVPLPDGMNFCRTLTAPLVDSVLASPQCRLLDAGDEAEMFDPSIRKYLVGVSVLAVPLLPVEGEMIGLVVLYRRGEQPFTDEDIELAEMIGHPTAIAVRRNE